MTNPDQPLHEHLRQHARSRPDRPALIWYGATLTWADLENPERALAKVRRALAAAAA